jgi:hypothetical protein
MVLTGDYELFVGGLGINKAFSETLTSAGHDVSKYAALHKVRLMVFVAIARMDKGKHNCTLL